ncbi:MAG TPA: SRPBCC family protein [Polyangia bacterium]|nr:SRPBCC family protein [Polyangia bacterium]
MGTIRKEILTLAPADRVWDAVRDVGALHTRLVPGFVVDTRLEPGARVVTFANGVVVREAIVTLDDEGRRLVWTSDGKLTTHYNSAAEVSVDAEGRTLVRWTSDFLPDDARERLDAMMTAGARAMKQALDALVG